MSDAVEPSQHRHAVLQLAQRVSALPEPAMRLTALAQALDNMGDARAVDTLQNLIVAAHAGHKDATHVYLAMIDPDAVRGRIATLRLQTLFEAAQGDGQTLALSWLFATLSMPQGRSDGIDPTSLVHRQLRQLTLGDRRALARTCRGEALKRVLGDPDPGVIANVLNNPHTTESSVLVVCSRRPTVPPPLTCVLRHDRWNRRYRVRLALARNPHLPLRFGVNLLVMLKDADLKDLIDDGTLASDLRFAAQRLIGISGNRHAAGG